MDKVQVSTVETLGEATTSNINQNVDNSSTLSSEESKTIALDEEEALKLKKKKKLGRILTFIGLQMSLFLAALDGTIVATALPRIGSDFNQMSIVAWVATAYILTFDAFQPLFSKFSDIFGRQMVLYFGIAVFLFGSVLCGAAQNIIMLIIARAIAGIGGAGIFSMVFVIFTDLVPLEQRGSYQGIVSAVFALSSVFGPLIGGSFTDYVSWRWNFYINLPIGAVAVTLLVFNLRLPIPHGKLIEKLKRVDYAGTIITLLFSTLFLLALNFGGQTFPWKSAAVIVPLVLSALLLVLLVIVESRYIKEPLMPPHLFKNRSVVSILITNWFFGMAFYSVLYYLPVYFQVVRGDSAMWSGIRLIPMQMVTSVFSVSSGILISKKGIYRPFIVIGMSLLTLWVGLLSLFKEETPFSQIYGIIVIGGAGLGLLFSSTIIALQASVGPKDIAVVTGLGNFTRILGGALGVAIGSTILNIQLSKNLPKVLSPELTSKVIQAADFVNHGLPIEFKPATLKIYVEAIQLIWYVFASMSALGLFSSCFVQHYSVRQQKQMKDEDVVVVNVPSKQDTPTEKVEETE